MLSLATLLCLPLPSLALPQGALLAWTPPPEPGAAEAVYDVYGIADGAPSHLGTTTLTSFLAPAGFERYLVQYRIPQGEGQVGTVCVIYNYPAWPWVDAEFPCE